MSFTDRDHETWRLLYRAQDTLRGEQLIPEFASGLKALGILGDKIPDLEAVNARLQGLTGWKGVSVAGFEGPEHFYKMLANREFPVGHFIRDQKDLSYTPEPDVFHDLYGHLPFYVMPEYGTFCEDFGTRGLKYLSSPEITEAFQRLFWFTAEFGLVKTPKGLRIFGAGIASSNKECAYALSGKPRLLPFDVETIRNTPFRIDLIQETLFVLDSAEQLYGCLDAFEAPYL